MNKSNQRLLRKYIRAKTKTRIDKDMPKTIPSKNITKGEGIVIILTIINIVLIIIFAYLQGLFKKPSS